MSFVRTSASSRTQVQSQHSSSSSDSSSVPKCPGHKEPCRRLQVFKEGKNKGRFFFVCAKPQDSQCKFFEWDNNGSASSSSSSLVMMSPNNRQASCAASPFGSPHVSQGSGSQPHSQAASSTGAKLTPLCTGHREPCVRFQVMKNNHNKGRWFFSCSQQGSSRCKTFFWEDELSSKSRSWKEQNCISEGGGSSSVASPNPVAKSLNVSSIKPIFELISKDQFEVRFEGRSKDARLWKFFDSHSLSQRRVDSKGCPLYVFPLTSYKDVLGDLKAISGLSLKISEIPKWVLKVFPSRPCTRHAVQFDHSKLPKTLWESLKPFQKTGVEFVVNRNGRALIADDMGLGKTIQSIAVSAYYESDWPVLVISPSSLRLHWRDAFLHWLPDMVSEGDIHVVRSGSDWPKCPDSVSIVIISYALVHKLKEKIATFDPNVVIVDESHMLKTPSSQRTKASTPILQKARRAILLSGTPALSRPSELHPQVSAITSGLVGKWREYGVRYCNGQEGMYGWECKGAINLRELNTLLTEEVMIRRLKKNVLKELPEKMRTGIPVSINARSKEMKRLGKDVGDLQTAVSAALDSGTDIAVNGSLIQLWKEAGLAKLDATKQLVSTYLNGSDEKFIIFAHHHEVLDGIEETLKDELKSPDAYMKIDGRVLPHVRNELVKKFQTQDRCRVALLGITAAGVGLTLTKASKVIFAELHWTPALLVQAEDRCHRIGQTSESVLISYVLGEGTVDTIMWPIIKRKMSICGQTLNRNQQQERIHLSFRNSDDQDGSSSSSRKTASSSSVRPQPRNRTLADYWNRASSQHQNTMSASAEIMPQTRPTLPIVPVDKMKLTLRNLGLKTSDQVVVYDNSNMLSSPVVWYTLSCFGFENVSVLNGGFGAWKEAGFEIETGPFVDRYPPNEELEDICFKSEMIVSQKQVLENLESREKQVVDARNSQRFLGEAPEPRPGMRSGHIPGSHNVPWKSLTDESSEGVSAFVDQKSIRDSFEGAGIDTSTGNKVIVTCGSGVTAAVLALGFRSIGKPAEDISLYDGSWSDWGREEAGTPVATGK